MRDRAGRQTWVRWIPSHLDPSQAEDAFEDWLIHWNGLVDQLATTVNADRSAYVWTQRQALRSAISSWSRRVDQLRQFFFLVADQQQCGGEDAPDQIQCISSDEEADDWLCLPWEDHLPVNWQVPTWQICCPWRILGCHHWVDLRCGATTGQSQNPERP